MIEAVNSLISNASALRSAPAQPTEAQVVNEQVLANEAPEVQLAPFVSPFISTNNQFSEAVIQIRDSDTGDVLTQFPSEPALRSRQATQALENQAVVEEIASQGVSSESSEDAAATAVNTVQTVVVAQSAPPAQSQGSGEAQAAIAALSTGAQSGQLTQTASVETSA